ncbi:hypothetical protein GCM10009730_64460 [Streptomyces albidochromogenes]
MNAFTVTVEQQADVTVIGVAGEMDLVSAPAVEEAALAAPISGTTLRLDLSGVSFMDSSGLNALLRLRQRVSGEAGRLVVAGLQDQPAGLLRLTETYELLTATGTVGVALPDQRQAPSPV